MSCPDWEELIRVRRSARDEPEEWRQALLHLESCDACRQRAVAEDPLLVFGRLAARGNERRQISRAEVETMSREVRAVVRSRSLESRRSRRQWPRAAAAALFLAAILTLSAVPPLAERVSEPMDGVGLNALPARPSAGGFREALPVAVVEGLDRSGARVYEMRQQGVSIVMIVDDTLDV